MPLRGYRGPTYRGEFSIPRFLPTDPRVQSLSFGAADSRHLLFAMMDGSELGAQVRRELARLPGDHRPVCVGAFEPRFAIPYGVWD